MMRRRIHKSLFSQHYLTHRLGEHDEWHEESAAALNALRDMYQQKRELLPSLDEAQTEQEFIQPILETVLAFEGAYSVQTAVHTHGRIQRPDYTLFANRASKTEADQYLTDEGAFYARGAAVADAKYWERPLSEKRRDDDRDQWRNSNPSFQIVNYLVATKLKWGILTNGRIWRLYSRHVSGTATEYYEVDLLDILEDEHPSLDDFKLFWLFFRRQAFVPDVYGRNFVERVRDGSAAYARVVGDTLKERVFNSVFPLLAGGFAADMERRGENPDADLVYEATLSFLYKLLFLLYGEARDLLPMQNRGYQSRSLIRMTQKIAEQLRRREPLGGVADDFYSRLLSMFSLIDRGDPEFDLPRYNGGLFHFDLFDSAAQKKHAANYFLTRYTISNNRLGRALDLLARIDDEAIDYGYLGVRHLGGMYEGLLEYKLIIDDAASGQVHLENDKGERKATGSYYTPDYIVKYIVRHTLEPILMEREAKFKQLMPQISKGRERLRQLEENLSRSERLAANVESRYVTERVGLLRDLPSLEKEARETLLDIKVCDPAMGSGHFLVEVVDYLTTNLITILNAYPDDNPALNWLADMRGSIVDAMAVQKIPVDLARLDDTQLLQRAVMKRCIYGVDLNRMAVELAKVSLWLHTFTVGAPLSFLDHHLRWGNSLIGVMAQEAAEEMTATRQQRKVSKSAQKLAAGRGEVRETAASYQVNIFSGPFRGLLQAAEIIRGISALSDATLEEVAQSEALFNEFDRQAMPYKRLLDVYVSRYFGVKKADAYLRLYGLDALKTEPEKLSKPYQKVRTMAQNLFAEKRFFHWDLEFPEVFIDLERADWDANGGFDAVVSNPPYGRYGMMDTASRQWIRHVGLSYKSGDVAEAFTSQAFRLSESAGLMGLVLPKVLTYAAGWGDLRAAIVQNGKINRIFDLKKAFADVLYEQIGICIEKNGRHKPKNVIINSMKDGELIEFKIPSTQFNQHIYRITADSAILNIIQKRNVSTVEAGQLYHVWYGKGGMVPSLKKEGEIKVLQGRNISRYSLLSSNLPTDFLMQTQINEDERNLYAQPKIVVQDIVAHIENPKPHIKLTAHLDESGAFCLNTLTCFAALPENGYQLGYLLAILNSRFMSWYVHTAIFNGAIRTMHFMPGYADRIPISRIEFGERKTAVSHPKSLYQQADYPAILHWTAAELSADRNDTVHDLLVFLAEEMMRLNQEKQVEVNGFLDWLAEYTELPIDEWQLKTIARAYYEKEWAAFRRALKRNGKKIRAVDVNGRKALSKIKNEHESSMSILAPLLADIHATDRLIDQIVYQLYGLTEAEIAIVEA